MARVLPGMAPQVVAHGQADVQPAFAWIEAHHDAFRGQWVAVRLVDPVLEASAPTLTQLWQRAHRRCSKTVWYITSARSRTTTRFRGQGGTCERGPLYV